MPLQTGIPTHGEFKAKQLKRPISDNLRFKRFRDLAFHTPVYSVLTLAVVRIILVSRGRSDVRLSTYSAQH